MPSLTLEIKFGGVLHQRILDGVRDRVKFSKRQYSARRKKWIENEEAALAYLPEREIDSSRRLLREGGKPQYTTIVLPYSYGVLMASHTYWTTVFMARSPVLQYAGRHGESEQQIQAIEALIDYQIQVGGMLVPFYIWLLDMGKYGHGVLGVYWVEEENVISEIVEEEEKFLGIISTGKKKRRKVSRRVPGYVGNKVYNIRPAEFLPDPRVTIARFQEGEFCGTYFELGWNTVLRRAEAGIYTNIDRLRRDKGGGTFSAREEGSSQLELPASDDLFKLESSRKAADVVKGYEMSIELIPEAWGLGKGTSPEKWIFTVTADFETVIGAQPLGAFHNKFPFHVIEMEPEGYGMASRGIPEIIKPIADTMNWLINSHFYNVRKTLNNQFIVDPSRIVMKDVEDPWPGGTIRAKPAAYGTRMSDAIHQFPAVDVTRGHLPDIQIMNEFGQRATGVSDQILGMIGGGGGRKTATEVRTSSSFGVNRLKTSAEYAAAMGWSPMSQMLVQNSQQYFDTERKFRLVGDLAQQAGPKFIEVDAAAIQGFYDFVPIDGTLPADRFAQANLWRELMGQMRNFPEVMAKYDVSRIFAWVAQLAGLKNINQFRIDLQPDEEVARQAEKGNLIPLGGGGAERDLTRVPEPGQVSNLGATG